jgi:heme oxygenase
MRMYTVVQPASELHEHLRLATKKAHHQLDHHPLLAPLLKTDLSRTQYGNALAALHGIQARSEERIQAFLDQQRDWPDDRLRSRLPALAADLAQLARQPMAAPLNWPELRNIGALIGLRYTMEGSSMGGQIIARTLRQHGHADLPMEFFDGQGDLSRPAWHAFLAFADAHCPSGEYDLAAATAVAVFDAIKAHLDDAWRCCSSLP